LATIFRDSYSKNLMGGGSLSWGRMRLLFACFLVLLSPSSASAAELSLARSSDSGVQFGTPHELIGTLREGPAPLAAQEVQLQGRPYPYKGAFRTVATTTTRPDGTFGFKRRFDRNLDLRAVAPAQGEQTGALRASVYPRPRSVFKALSGSRLRITQFLRTAPNVRLTARTTFYLGPENAKSAPPVARAKPRRIGRGRFKASAVVKLPRAWKGAFRYGSCFRYSEGSGMGAPGATCPKRYRF
jgi:hypothetical protein